MVQDSHNVTSLLNIIMSPATQRDKNNYINENHNLTTFEENKAYTHLNTTYTSPSFQDVTVDPFINNLHTNSNILQILPLSDYNNHGSNPDLIKANPGLQDGYPVVHGYNLSWQNSNPFRTEPTLQDHNPFSNNTTLLSPPITFPDFTSLQMDMTATFMRGLQTYDQPYSIALMCLYSVVFVIGLIGNCMVITVIAKYKHMRTVTNLFFLNLAIGDLLVVVICMPFTLAPYLYKVSLYSKCVYLSICFFYCLFVRSMLYSFEQIIYLFFYSGMHTLPKRFFKMFPMKTGLPIQCIF